MLKEHLAGHERGTAFMDCGMCGVVAFRRSSPGNPIELQVAVSAKVNAIS